MWRGPFRFPLPRFSSFSFRGAHGHQRRATDDGAKQLLGMLVGFSLVQTEFIDEAAAEYALDHHGGGVFPAVQ